MKQVLSFFLLLISITAGSQVKRATGLTFNDETYKMTRRLSPALKWSEADLPAYSLKNFCPLPGDQGNIGSCVGWATGYAALTISDAVRKNATNKTAITDAARSAMYIYLQIVEECPDGSVISDALDLVKTKGDCLAKDFGPQPCGTSIPSSLNSLAAQFKIKEYYTLFEINGTPEQKITATRNSIMANKPVIIGIKVTNSIFNVGSSGIWTPSPAEEIAGGHALCVVGYDDQKKMFEIINSWGTGWGNNGFFKISYDDYGKYCKYGYQFTLEGGGGGGKEVNMTGNFKFKKFNSGIFEDAAVKLAGTEYTIDDVRKDDFFRIAASNITKDNYVYIFSIKPDNSAEILFPTQKQVDGVTVKDIPVVPANDVVLEIPVDPKKGLTTDMSGNDLLCILYSVEEIKDIEEVVLTAKNSSGDFTERLKKALGNRLIPSSDIKYSSTDMGLTVKTKNGTVAPLVLKVKVQ